LQNVAIYKCIKTMSYIDVQIPTILQLNITIYMNYIDEWQFAKKKRRWWITSFDVI
jgi:hypothetical protein